MIYVQMAEEQVDLAGLPRQCLANRSKALAGVDDYAMLAADNLDARCVAAESHGVRSRTGDATANAPEYDRHRICHLKCSNRTGLRFLVSRIRSSPYQAA